MDSTSGSGTLWYPHLEIKILIPFSFFKQEDRILASSHLMATSIVLLLLFFLILCHAAVRGGSANKLARSITDSGRVGADGKELLAA